MYLENLIPEDPPCYFIKKQSPIWLFWKIHDMSCESAYPREMLLRHYYITSQTQFITKLKIHYLTIYLKNARIPQLLQVVDELHYWVYYLFLINFIAFIFILCFLVAFLGHEFLFSILFCCDYIIALGMKNCFGFEKLLWVRYSITFQMLSLIFYIGVIINEILFN